MNGRVVCAKTVFVIPVVDRNLDIINIASHNQAIDTQTLMDTEASIKPITVVGTRMKFVFRLYAAHANLPETY